MAANLADNPQLLLLKKLVPGFPLAGQTCLVGGAIRDLLLGIPPLDFDFATEHDPTPLARALAGEGGGHWFWLDERRRQSRVGIGSCSFDFAPWRAATLYGDLAARDFTINAMALDLAGALSTGELIDPLGGRADLVSRVLRCAGPEVLQDDPLRILRGIRHAVELGLTVEPGCLDIMRATVPQLASSAPERVRLEIWKILAAPEGGRGLELLTETGADRLLFGGGFAAALDLARHALRRADVLFAALASHDRVIAERLREPVEQGLDRGGLLRWWRVLGCINPEQPLMLAYRWRFSRGGLSRIAALGQLTAQPWAELVNVPCRPRPVALWARQYGPDPFDLLLALGLLRSDDAETVRDALLPYLQALAGLADARQVPPLIDGRWLMSALGKDGAELGAIHAMLRRAEIEGVVSTAEEARDFLRRRFPKNS